MTEIETKENKEPKVNRTYKDSMFCDYLAEPRRLVEVYNAAFDEHYPLDTAVEISGLDDVLYMDRVNDVSFILDNKFVVLLEQQSTVNQNMPLRMLLYVARLYEKLLDNQNIYKRGRINLFTPRFVLFYNGTDNQPEYMVQRLSDAFIEKMEQPALELEVVLYNIRRSDNHVPEILKKCKSLDEYSFFIEPVEQRYHGKDTLGHAIKEAIKVCLEKGIMAEYLKEKGSEVLNMLLTEWNWEDAERVWRAEEFEKGVASGRAEGRIAGRTEGVQQAIRTLMNNMAITAEQAMDLLSISDMDRGQYLASLK